MSIALRCKSILSVAVASAMLSVFCVAGFAAQTDNNTPLGALNSTGSVNINGNKALSGASIFSGSTISTGPDGVATLDLRQLGRIIVRPSTTITLTVVGNAVQVAEHGRSVLVAVMSGSAQVASSQGNKTLRVSEQNTFTGNVQVNVSPGSVVVLQNQGNNKPGQTGTGGAPAGHAFNPPWWGFVILGGVAAGVAAGVATHGGENKAPATLSPAVP